MICSRGLPMAHVKKWLVLFPFLCAAASPDPVDLFKRHHYEQASALWEKDVRNAPLEEKGVRSLKGLSLAHHQLGSLYSRLHPFSQALLSEFYRGVLSQGQSPLALYYLGQVQYQKGRFDSAESCFEKARKSRAGKALEENEVFLAFAQARGKGTRN